MECNVKIRVASVADAKAMQGVARRAYAAAMARIPDLPDVVGSIASDIQDHSALAAEIADMLVGFVIMAEQGKVLKLMNLAVDPAVKGQGIAQHLIAAAEQHGRSLGKTRMALVTHKDMTRALGLYRHMGWQESARIGNTVHMTRPM